MKLSIISPVYKAKTIIPELVRRIVESVSKITDDFEIILVDDGCPENSWEAIALECQKDKRIKGIKLSRNFGQHHAITAGLDNINGDWIVVMDCDLQDQPEEIPKLYSEALKGYDIVFACRLNRKDIFLKKIISIVFYKLLSYLTNRSYDTSVSNFGIYAHYVIESINQMREPYRAFPPMAMWVGFHSSKIEVKHSERYYGKSSYDIRKLFFLALDISLAYSSKPLSLVLSFGFITCFLSVVLIIYYLINYYLGYIKISGFTTLILSISFFSGVIIFVMGIVGLYVSKIFEATKNRPIYLIAKKIN